MKTRKTKAARRHARAIRRQQTALARVYVGALELPDNPRETETEYIQRRALRSITHAFAENGDPWSTQRDWEREEQNARNPNQNTRIRKSASDYVARASQYPRLANPKRELPPEPIPETVESREARIAREVFKLKQAREKAKRPAFVHPIRDKARVLLEAEAERFRQYKPEPTSYAPPKPLVDSDEVRNGREKHDRWMAEQLGLTYEDYMAALERKRQARAK